MISNPESNQQLILSKGLTVGLNKKFIVQSNWKMHKTHAEGTDWIAALKKIESEVSPQIEMIPCVPLTLLQAMAQAVQSSSKIFVGVQNVFWENWGAYSGEISAPMIADAGASYCMLGHSERRAYFFETDKMVNRKTRALLEVGIRPIVCIGESIEERQKKLTLNKLERQVITCFEGLSNEQMQETAILYEPLWSIGTGDTATPQQAQDAHAYIRLMLERVFSKETAAATRIVYGGSVKTHNVAELVAEKDIDGVGVGSGSLDVKDFIKIVRISSEYAAANPV
jgi:triosephosphate isomerase